MNFTTPCSIEGLVAGLIILLSCSICISKGIWLLHWEDVVMETRPCSIRKCCARLVAGQVAQSHREKDGQLSFWNNRQRQWQAILGYWKDIPRLE